MNSPDLNEALVAYRRSMRDNNVPAGTIKSYTNIARRLAVRYPGRRFAGITTQDLADFLYGEAGILVGKASYTQTAYRSALRSFFAFGQLKGWTKTVTVVPQPVFRARTVRSHLAPTRLDEGELLSLLDRAEHPMLRGMIATGISTALRICDIQKIRVTDIDLVMYELYVWIQKTQQHDAKPITLDLEEELRLYMAWYSSEAGGQFGKEGFFLFPGFTMQNMPVTGRAFYVPDPSRHVSYMWGYSRLVALYEKCGIRVAPREAWHVIRRSVARIYFDRLRLEISHDHALRQTMALLNHSNQETTERYLGLQAEIRARNESLRGRRFLQRPENIAPIRRASRSGP